MKNIKFIPLALALTAGAPAVMAADALGTQWANFYTTLDSFVKGGVANSPTRVLLSIPGIPLDQMSKSSRADKTYINTLFDLVAKDEPTYAQTDRRISDLYLKILDGSQLIKTAPVDKSKAAADKAELESVTKELADLTPNYDTYNEALSEAADARLTEQLADQQNGGSGKASSKTELAWKNAVRDLDQKGKKSEYDKCMKRYAELVAVNPSSYWQRLKDKMTSNEFDGTYNIITFPPLDNWAANTGWLTFSFKSSNSTSDFSSNSLDVKAEFALKVAKASVEGSAGYLKTEEERLANDKSFELTMDVKRVYLYRPWLDSSLFRDDNWKWAQGKEVISDGKGGGSMGLIPSSFIIVRNVVFKANSINSFAKKMEEDIQAKLKASFGPFSMSAAVAKNKKGENAGKNEEATAVSIPDPQIIAYTVTMPDPTPLSQFPDAKKK